MTIQEKALASHEEILEMLRNKSPLSTLTEHWFLLDEAWKEVEGLPQPMQFAKGLTYILERASVPVAEHDLFLGRFIDKVPDDAEEKRYKEIWAREEHLRPQYNPIVKHNHTHITLDWKSILGHGLGGYISKTEAKLKELRDAGSDKKELIFIESMLIAYRACSTYISRYSEAAKEAGQDELAEICANVALGAPSTFREALQLFLLILNIDYLYAGNLNPTICYGRLDEMLLPLYEADLAAGRLTREDAGYLIDDFNCKACLTLGRGEHQMADPRQGGNITGFDRNNAYDDPTYIVIGGYTAKGKPSSPLTKLFLERIQPRYENPVYIYRWTKEDPEDVFELLCDKLRQNSSILVYNDETVIPAMLNAGIAKEDALEYTMHGCNWPDVPSYSTCTSVGGPIPKMIMAILLDGRSLRKNYGSIDEIYDAVGDHFRASVRERFAAYRARYRSDPQPPSEFLSITECFTEGVIEKARNIFDGGVRYPVVYTLIRNIGTAADIMSALDEVVFTKKLCTLEQLAKALEDDFASAPELRTHCLKAAKFGTDNDAVDRHAIRLMNTLLDIIDQESVNEKGEKDVISFNVTITDMWHIQEGATLCATPDGRRCGAPLSENLSPTVGNVESVTALLNSVSKLPFERINSGALNVRLRKDAVKGEEGLVCMCALLSAYLENGGMQLQLSVADTAELRQAQEHPEDYKDLMVRITGYSAVFVDMSRNSQEEFIRRDELGV